MKRFLYILLAVFLSPALQSFNSDAGHMLTTRTGHVWFHSSAPLETIEAHNYQVSSALNPATGDLIFSVLIKAFEFNKALMQEHFNENYMESDKFPQAAFKGKILDLSKVNLKVRGIYPVTVEGELTIHGVTSRVKHNGTIQVAEDAVLAKAVFPVRLKDYNIEIPRLVKDKIAEVVDVNVDMKYQGM